LKLKPVHSSSPAFFFFLDLSWLRGAGALAYEMSFPWMGYYFFRLALCMSANWDIAIVCTVAAVLNFAQSRQRPYWHIYQVHCAYRGIRCSEGKEANGLYL
jgi:hypothetical protein